MGNGLTLIGFGSNVFSPDSFDTDVAGLLRLGNVVQRAAANLPQTATAAIFTVAGGRVLITQLTGEVTTVIQTQANNTKLQANPTAAGSSVDICANLDITALAVATLLGITGTFANAMVSGLALPAQATPVVVQTGTIDLVCAASNTGQVKWTVRYVPLDEGATVVAA